MPIPQPLVGIPRITITKDMVLRQIMYHEFPKRLTTSTGAESLGLDEEPLTTYLDGLTPRQLEYLLTYEPPSGANDCLVVFISKTSGKGKLHGSGQVRSAGQYPDEIERVLCRVPLSKRDRSCPHLLHRGDVPCEPLRNAFLVPESDR
ncbi:MAG: hypothetical protein QM784_31815 [Polyangiaceae bacterium]